MHGKSHDDVLRNVIANLKIDDYAKNKIFNRKISKVSSVLKMYVVSSQLKNKK